MILFPPYAIKNYKRAKNTGEKSDQYFHHFYKLPIVKFCSNTLFYLAFLTVLAVTVTTRTTFFNHVESFTKIEQALYIWVFGLIVDEVVQYIQDPEGHFEEFWNKMDFTMYSLLILTFVLRLIALLLQIPDLDIISQDVLTVNMIICFLRILNVFSVNFYLGPLLIMIGRMIRDITLWIFIWFVFFLSFSLAFVSMTRESRYAFPARFSTSQEPEIDLEWTGYPVGTLYLGFWSFLGEFGSSIPLLNYTYIGSFLLAIYLLLANVLLVNLLIAMMADTYSDIKENSDIEWKFSRYSLIQEYTFANLTPPPLNLILYFFQGIYLLANCACTKPRVPEETVIYRKNKKEEQQVLDLLASYKELFLEQEELNQKESVESRVQTVKEKIDLVSLHRTEDRDFIENRFKNMEQAFQKLAMGLNIKLDEIPNK